MSPDGAMWVVLLATPLSWGGYYYHPYCEAMSRGMNGLKHGSVPQAKVSIPVAVPVAATFTVIGAVLVSLKTGRECVKMQLCVTLTRSGMHPGGCWSRSHLWGHLRLKMFWSGCQILHLHLTDAGCVQLLSGAYLALQRSLLSSTRSFGLEA